MQVFKMTVNVDRVSEHEGHDYRRQPLDWKQIDWQKTQRIVRNLQRRIFRAAQQKNCKKVKHLTRLLLRSYSNLLISVRETTIINQGRKTPGIDGKVILTDEARSRLVMELSQNKIWRAKPVRRVYVPKANGRKRPLGIPTIADRVLQCMVKNAYEPRFETEFETNSFGFRPGRNTWDAIEGIHAALNQSTAGRNQYILDADIRSAFDHINHNFILQKIGQMPGRHLMQQWLRTGYVEYGKLYQTLEGTPQGGIISPLLCNIALDGLQEHLGKGYRYVRYADDFVVMTKTKEMIEAALPRIKEFLQIRGLELNEEKARIVHKSEGFNFLGFHIQDRKGKLLITPQKEKVKTLLTKVRTWLKENKQATPETVIRVLNPILRGWANYYSTCVAKRTFQKINHNLWEVLWRWTVRRHPNKPYRWIYEKYFTCIGKQNYQFFTETTSRRGKKAKMVIENVARIPIIRHIKVRGAASPFNPTLSQYWEQRNKQTILKRILRRGIQRQIAEKQYWRCSSCRCPLGNGEMLELHHRIPISKGGSDDPSNLVWLHRACHWALHKKERAALCQSA